MSAGIEELISIGKLAELTETNAVTLRAWERRYGLLAPQRTKAGQRLYNAEDVAQVKRIKSFAEQGVSVGRVKSLLALEGQQTSLSENEQTIWTDYLGQVLAAAAEFDINALDNVYKTMIASYAIEVISTHLFLPLLKTYKARIAANYQNTLAEEHFLASYIRNRLGAIYQKLVGRVKGKVFVFAALPGERHEMILLLFAIHCLVAGCKVINLGINTPLEEVAYAAGKLNADAIVVFGELNKPTKKMISATIPMFSFYPMVAPLDKKIKQLPEDFSDALKIIIKR
jgi:DNA-binding transcriptional MerR regulator